MNPSSAVQRPDLGLVLEEYDLLASQAGFVANRVFRVTPVDKQTANYSVVPIEELLKSRDTKRAPGAGYARQSAKFEQASYACKENGAEEAIDDREATIYSQNNGIQSEVFATKRAMDVVLRNREIRVADAVFNTSTWTGSTLTTAVGTEWSVVASAKPVDDVLAASKKIYDLSGLLPNALVINWHVYKNLTQCAQVIDRIKYSGRDDPKNVTAQMLAELFGIDEVIVAGAQKNTADTVGGLTLSKVWSDEYAMLCRIARTDDVREVCIGRTFSWNGDGGDASRVEMYRDESVRSNIVRVREDTDEKVIYSAVGHLLSNITA